MVSWLNKLYDIPLWTLENRFPSSPSSLEVWLPPADLGISQAATLRLCTPSLPASLWKTCLFCKYLQFWASQSIQQSGIASALSRGSHLGRAQGLGRGSVAPGCLATPFVTGQSRCRVTQQPSCGHGWAGDISSSEKGGGDAAIYPLIKSFTWQGKGLLAFRSALRSINSSALILPY